MSIIQLKFVIFQNYTKVYQVENKPHQIRTLIAEEATKHGDRSKSKPLETDMEGFRTGSHIISCYVLKRSCREIRDRIESYSKRES